MGKYTIQIDGTAMDVTLLRKEGTSLEFQVEGSTYQVTIQPKVPSFAHAGNAVTVPTAAKSAPKPAQNAHEVRAPMPGIIVSVDVAEGQKVEAGQNLLIIEAMKMENNIQATHAATVKKVHVTAGQEIDNHQILITFDEP